MAAGTVQLPANSSGQLMQTFVNVVANTNNVGCSAVAVVTSAGVSCDPPSGTGVAVGGNVNSNGADSGAPVKVAGVYNSTLPAAASGARLDLQVDVNGRQLVAASGDVAAAAADGGNPVKVGAVFLQYSSLPAYTTGQRGNLQIDPAGTLKVGNVPLGTPVYASVTTVNANAGVQLTIPSGKMGYLDGFDVDGTGATAAGSVSVVVSGILGGSLTFVMPIVAGNTAGVVPLSRRFSPALQSSATGTNIVVTVPNFGSGSLAQSTNAYGRYI